MAMISPLTMNVSEVLNLNTPRQHTVCVLCEEENSHSHLFLLSSTHSWHMALLLHLFGWQQALLILVRFLCCHLRGEISRGDRVDSDPSLLEFGAHHLCQMDSTCLGGVVGKVTLGMAHDSAHGRDGDDRRSEAFCRSIGLDGGLQQGKEGKSCEVDGGHVGAPGAVPVFDGLRIPELLLELFRIIRLWLRLWTTDAGITDCSCVRPTSFGNRESTNCTY